MYRKSFLGGGLLRKTSQVDRQEKEAVNSIIMLRVYQGDSLIHTRCILGRCRLHQVAGAKGLYRTRQDGRVSARDCPNKGKAPYVLVQGRATAWPRHQPAWGTGEASDSLCVVLGSNVCSGPDLAGSTQGSSSGQPVVRQWSLHGKVSPPHRCSSIRWEKTSRCQRLTFKLFSGQFYKMCALGAEGKRTRDAA